VINNTKNPLSRDAKEGFLDITFEYIPFIEEIGTQSCFEEYFVGE